MNVFTTALLISLTFFNLLASEETFTSYLWPWWEEEPAFPQNGFDLSHVTSLEQILSQRVVNQPWAIKAVSNAMTAYKAQIHDPGRPIGCFLFIGASGVGKTELAKALAEEIGSSPEQFVHLNMSEYNNDRVGLDRLIGLPHGYIESEKGGELSNAILKNPYSVILLDEFEKADKHARLLFLHIFDEGFFRSGRTEYVDCRNCIFIATTNLGSHDIETKWTEGLSPEAMLRFIKPTLIAGFTPELYNRMEPVLFQKISDLGLVQIIHLKLKEVIQRIYQNRQIELRFDDSIINYIFFRCIELNNGARSILGIIKGDIVPVIARAIIDHSYKKNDRLRITYHQGSIVVSQQGD